MEFQKSTQKTVPGMGRYVMVGVGLVVCILAFALLQRWDLRASHSFAAQSWNQPVPENLMTSCSLTIREDYIVLDGYAFLKGERLESVENYVVLYDTQQESYLRLATAMINRQEATAAGADGISYDRGGFSAFVSRKDLKKDISGYEVCIAYGANDHAFLAHTGILLEETQA